MVTLSTIQANLKSLDRKYNKATSIKDSLFYSKLALLELCGWIEESMDDIIRRHAGRHLTKKCNLDHVKTQIIKRTNSFDYHQNFRNMLIRLIGIIGVEQLETRLDQHKLQVFTATLATLKQARDSEAHTHIRGITRRINAPSATLALLPSLFEGLRDFDSAIQQQLL